MGREKWKYTILRLLYYIRSRIISLEVEYDMLKMYTITFNVTIKIIQQGVIVEKIKWNKSKRSKKKKKEQNETKNR